MATAKEEGDGSPVKNEAPEAKLLDRIAERDQVIRRLRESLERERATRAHAIQKMAFQRNMMRVKAWPCKSKF